MLVKSAVGRAFNMVIALMLVQNAANLPDIPYLIRSRLY